MPKKAKFERLRSMGKERLEVVESLMTKGESMASIATKVQEEWGLFDDVKHDTLKKQLQRYYKQQVEPYLKSVTKAHEKNEQVKEVEATVTEETELNTASKEGVLLLKKPVPQRDVLAEMNELIEVQKGRARAVLERESNLPSGMLLSEATHAITGLQKLYVEYANLQMDLGVLHRVPRQHLLEAPRELEAMARKTHLDGVKAKDEARKAASRVLSILGKGD